ncbi:MAG: hypothetical protein IPM43_13485 [Actinomycetota bacterium]|nr:MAG: hypothetical protein IPM43_13485 [Actinomycetota bacterium]
MRNRLISSVAIAAGALAIAACGGDDAGSSPEIPADADLVVRAVPTIRWDSPTYTVTGGEAKVVLVNEESIYHDMVILEGDNVIVGDVNWEVTAKGDVAVQTLTLEPGEYAVFCRVPGHSTMNSTLTVS